MKLTTDPIIRVKLKNKLIDYTNRYGYTAPEQNPVGFFKLAILSDLLELKEILINNYVERFSFGNFLWAIEEAYLIINCYNNNDLINLRNSQGF